MSTNRVPASSGSSTNSIAKPPNQATRLHEQADIQPHLNDTGLSIEIPVTKWLVRDHLDAECLHMESVGLLPTGDLLLVDHAGPDYCALSRHRDFASLAQGETTDGQVGNQPDNLDPALLVALAHTLPEVD